MVLNSVDDAAYWVDCTPHFFRPGSLSHALLARSSPFRCTSPHGEYPRNVKVPAADMTALAPGAGRAPQLPALQIPTRCGENFQRLFSIVAGQHAQYRPECSSQFSLE